MANPIDPIKNLARFLAKSKVKDRMYHITNAEENFSVFNPQSNPAFQRRGIFVSPDPDFTNLFGAKDPFADVLEYGKNTRTMPVHVNVKKPFDYDNPAHLKKLSKQVEKETGYPLDDYQLEDIEFGHWEALEAPEVTRAIKNLGHDAYYVSEELPGGGDLIKNLAVFEPTQIKSAIGNRGTYDPLEADITKAEGGTVNPIKTPREMLFEMVGMPHMSTGKSVDQAFTLAQMIKRAIKDYILENKRQPSAQEIADLKAYAQTLSQPTSGLRTGMSAQPERAQRTSWRPTPT